MALIGSPENFPEYKPPTLGVSYTRMGEICTLVDRTVIDGIVYELYRADDIGIYRMIDTESGGLIHICRGDLDHIELRYRAKVAAARICT